MQKARRRVPPGLLKIGDPRPRPYSAQAAWQPASMASRDIEAPRVRQVPWADKPCRFTPNTGYSAGIYLRHPRLRP